MNKKAYEQTNHLGNVLVTVSDARQVLNSGATVTGFSAIVKSASDYSAFGATMAGRSYTTNSYRYSFNGKEQDLEATFQDYGMRMYDSRLARFISVDPIARKYPSYTTYQFAGNKPIPAVDVDGLEEFPVYQSKEVMETSIAISTVDYQGSAVTAVTFSTTYINYYVGDGCEENADPEVQGCDPMQPSATEGFHIYTVDITVYIDGDGNIVGGEYITQSADYSPEDENGQRTMSNYQSTSGNELTSWGPNMVGFAGESETSPEVRFGLSDLAGNVLLNTMEFNSTNDIDAPKQIEQEAIAPVLNPTQNAGASVVSAVVKGPLAAVLTGASVAVALSDYYTATEYSGIARRGITLWQGAQYTAGDDPNSQVVLPIGQRRTNTGTADELLSDPNEE